MHSVYPLIIARLRRFGRTYHWWVAGGLLALMLGLGLTSMAGDSAIVDEVAHIPAAYSYLHYGDYRLNPEHPPLIKDLAGIPLQFMDLKFPESLPAWTTGSRGQWETGWYFLYRMGNDADAMLWWSRLPILLLAVVFGAVLYWFVGRRWGIAVGLLALFFYALSPSILAHSRFVTTDLGATVFLFLALMAFVSFVERPGWKSLVILSLALAGANLAKFNAFFILYPFLAAVTLVVVATRKEPRAWPARAKVYLGGFTMAAAASVLWIWIYYVPHTLNMPVEVQQRITTAALSTTKMAGVGQGLVAMSEWDVLRPLAQYGLGLSMVYTRVTSGNVTYFNGQVSDQSFHGYFPELFLLKTQVAFLLLGVVVLAVTLGAGLRQRPFRLVHIMVLSWRRHLLEWTIGGFAVFYFAVSVVGNLNLGIRHILPVYVPLFVLVAVGTVALMRRVTRRRRLQAGGVLVGLLVWYAGSTLWIHPSYVAYLNELVGGPAQAHHYFTDSSVDWGQDLKRLKAYVEAHPEIGRLALDYFGGGEPRYYFCDRQGDGMYDCSRSVFEEWHSDYGPYTGQYIAVSETYLQNDLYFAARAGTIGYQYLRTREPIAKIGYSIYLYKLY